MPATGEPTVPAPSPAGSPRLSPPPIPANRGPLSRHVLRFFPRLEREEDHPRAWQFPRYLDNPATPWIRVLKEIYASPYAFPASIAPQAGLMLFSLVRNIRPRTVVEVGSFVGVSTIWMAAALEDAAGDPPNGPGSGEGIIHAFDDFGPMPAGPWRESVISESRLPLVEKHLNRAGLMHRVALHPGKSAEEIVKAREMLRGTLNATLSPWGSPVGAAAGPAGRGGVDLALIDGDHSVEGALQDFWAVEPVLNTGGYVLLHDTYPEQCGNHEGPRHIIDHIRSVGQGVYEVCELYTAPLNYGMALLRRVG